MTTHTTSTPVRRAALALALPLLGGLALAGCSAGSAPASAPGAAPSAASAAPTAGAGAGAGADVTGQAPADGALAAAVDTAIAAVPGSELVSVDQEAGGTSWEVVVAEQDGREHEVHTGADGSAVTAGPVTDADDADDLADTAALLRGASVGHADAASAMTGAVAGTVTELALDEDGGRILWEGDVVDASGVTHSVRVDAASGEVVDRSVED
ncbi:PepSY domain-containing protein [Clavibacter tessellarius]|uniref:PepSY domain-containing protein n=1 Tax=Clavibacter tessellarius TaxID=31965 RepID=UPI0039EAB5F0